MSRQAYLEIYGQEPPAGARFGCDLSWFQASRDGESLDSATLHNTWAGLAGWAEYVCIRCSYGGSGDDGAEAAHVQYADIHHYGGTLGGYHYFGPGRTPADNANNYVNRSRPFADRFTFDMLDVEEGTTAGAIEETLDRISQAKGRECLLYSGKGIMDPAGYLGRKRPLWVAHYATRSYRAWAPTTNWNLWQAPYMPNQYGDVYPTCWQFTSFTANHGHLDLNMTTTPAAFGLDGAVPVTPPPPAPPASEELFDMLTQEQQAQLFNQVNAIFWMSGGTYPTAGIPTVSSDSADTLALLRATDTVTRDVYNRGEWTGAAVAALPAAVTAAVAAAVKALPVGAGGGALSAADLVKVQAAAAAAVAEALESIHIEVAPAAAADVADDTADEPPPPAHAEGWGTFPPPADPETP